MILRLHLRLSGAGKIAGRRSCCTRSRTTTGADSARIGVGPRTSTTVPIRDSKPVTERIIAEVRELAGFPTMRGIVIIDIQVDIDEIGVPVSSRSITTTTAETFHHSGSFPPASRRQAR